MPEDASHVLEKKLVQIRRDAEERDAERRANRIGYPYVDIRKTPISLEAVKLLTLKEAQEAQVAPLEIRTERVAIAAYDPRLPAATRVFEKLKSHNHEPKIFIVSHSGLEQAWQFYKFLTADAKEITGKVEIENRRLEELLGRLKTFQTVAEELKKFDLEHINVTNFIEVILAGALANRASDVHFEAEEKNARIRFRLDGLLHDIFDQLPVLVYENVVSRIKLLSGLKINVHGKAQDGRFTIELAAKEIEVRVSIIPSEFGETIVMRILDPEGIQVKLKELGLREDDLSLVEQELNRPNGLILNTGPTGSGKTTTLYAFLLHIVNPEIKIITIEDPIEYRVRGIEQTQVDPEMGYTFANGLRAILRQDPDAILVGEIRDGETADISMQASLTGHLVFSTLHTNDAVGAVPRLIDLGLKAQTIGPALSLIIAQRLVRRLCTECRKPASLTPELKKKIEQFLGTLPKKVNLKDYTRPELFTPGGCVQCNGFGYRGRVGIFEFLQGGSELEEVILHESSEVALRRIAEHQGMVSMQSDGVLKALEGATTFDEVERITGTIPWLRSK